MKYVPHLLSSERLFCGSYASNDSVSPDGRVYMTPAGNPDKKALYSPDFGSTWEIIDSPKAFYNDRFVCLSDGSFISFGFDNAGFNSVVNKQQENFPFVLAVTRAGSMDDILSGNVSTYFVNVDIPGLCAGFGDSGNAFAGCMATGICELSNGDLLVTMYGQFSEDKTLCPYFCSNGNYTFYLYRTWCIVSHDKGRTFEYLTTIADVQTHPIADVNAEGYCESDCVETEPGHLVCLLRTGGHEVHSPLYCSHSYDFGKTWEAPYEICDWGVLPRLLKMHDGTLVCVSGHIHTMLLFSGDSGRTWSEPFIAEPCDGKWDKSPSGYNTVLEYKPGELCLIFDDPKEGIAEGAPAGRLRNLYLHKYRIDKLN